MITAEKAQRPGLAFSWMAHNGTPIARAAMKTNETNISTAMCRSSDLVDPLPSTPIDSLVGWLPADSIVGVSTIQLVLKSTNGVKVMVQMTHNLSRLSMIASVQDSASVL